MAKAISNFLKNNFPVNKGTEVVVCFSNEVGNFAEIKLIRTNSMEITPTRLGFEGLFQESFKKFFDPLHRYAFTILKNSDQASDAVQSVFIKWWETKTAIANLDEVRKYLFTAVYRSSLNVIRNEKVKQFHVVTYSQEQESETKFHDSAELEELDMQIKLAIDSLPPQCRTIFYKSRFEEKKYAEIATDMNLSVKTIEVQMGKALKLLREKLIVN